MIRLYILIFILLFPMIQSAEEVFKLQTCIEKGLQQNYQLQIVRNEQRIVDNNVSLGNAGYLPTVDIHSSLDRTNENSKQYPHDDSTPLINTGANNQNMSTGISLNWTLFDGFNMQANYSKLKEIQQIGVLQTRMDIENFMADLIAEYYNLIQHQIRYKNLQSALRLSKERLRIVEARYLIGNLSRLDLQQARVDFNTDSSRLIRQREVLYASKININRLIGEEEVEREFKIADKDINFDELLDKEFLWQQTLSQNTYLLMAEREKNMKVLELQSVKSRNYPYVTIHAGYRYADNIYELGPYKRQNNLGLNYGITLGYNIFDGFNRSRRKKNAQIEIKNQTLEVADVKLSLKSEFSNLWMAYINNLDLTKLEKENLTHAVENYDIAIERYKLGDLSGIELREAQNSLLEAEERLVDAQYLTKLCEISLLQISGRIMQYLE